MPIAEQNGLISTKTHWLLWLSLIVIYAALRFNTLAIPLDRDEGAFGLMGQMILNGGVPYVDGIDNKPPLIFFTFAAFLAFFPATAESIHIGLQIYNFFSLIVIFLLGKQLVDYAVAYWAAFLFALWSINPYLQGFTASSEMFLLLPLSACFLMGLLAIRSSRIDLWYVFGSGMLAALACWYKQPAAFSVLGIVMFLAWKVIADTDGSAAMGKLMPVAAIWLLGGVLCSAVIVIYFYLNDAIAAFYYWSFEHPMLYSSSIPVANKVLLFWHGLKDLLGNMPLAFLCMVLALKSELGRWLFLLLALSLFATLLGFGFAHYFAQILPALCLLGAIGVASVTRAGRLRSSRIKTGLAGIVILVAAVWPNQAYHLTGEPERFSREYFGANPFPESVAFAEYLNTHTAPDQRIFVFGSEPQILLLAERQSATPYFVLYPLFRSAFPRYLEFQEQVATDVSASEPAYIIVVNLQQSLNHDGDAELAVFDFLVSYTAEHYALDRAFRYDETAANWVPDRQYDIQSSQAAIAFFKRN